ncbi:hypothetical protein KUG88_25370 [Rhodococcus rhodochrous]|uniref:hypothetical protein n=1 Tax=Rhodococcus rhodochrous TaxID=1829 RepID=UPI001E63C7DD|nr:hypothetical protein [Rhodococcus rhodochrous]MCB8913448.1 hypothetical protein [Rhodococcus rhodochrous]
MSDWTCRVSGSISRQPCSAQLLLVLADGMSTPEVQTRVLEIAREHYGPDARIDEVCPEDWVQVHPGPDLPTRTHKAHSSPAR